MADRRLARSSLIKCCGKRGPVPATDTREFEVAWLDHLRASTREGSGTFIVVVLGIRGPPEGFDRILPTSIERWPSSTTLVAFSRRRSLPSVWLFLHATDHQITRKPSLPVKELW